ncbi:hypothetical protein JDV02_008437 [Purpureocillium takamizusanense]|uniref:Subtilisin-like protease n=1 Tax=Purpureocillium takamizusanense TaxID=2060973 RepID=A0A9Q8QM29_9HYPO|nr:uncharacterized protein JDV02_008437 [Purpureocillium takamizusanense]UNI22558.1 hypothetical protein JDV02_008437 [Purpureocillium takamizusanense]
MLRSAFTSILLATSSVLATTATDIPPLDVVPDTYLIELKKGHQLPELIDSLKGLCVTVNSLDHKLFKAVSCKTNSTTEGPVNIEMLKGISAADNVSPVQTATFPVMPKGDWSGAIIDKNMPTRRDPATSESNDAYAPHIMAQVDQLHAEGINGTGIKVAILDSGIDYNHSDLGGCFGPGCLVSFGADLSGDPHSDSDAPEIPMDCMVPNGHGTGVAGVLAGRTNAFGFGGVAPGVSVGSYKVIDCHGKVRTDRVIEAINKAFDDGADIISITFELPIAWRYSPVAVAISRVVHSGTMCIVTAGNSGELGPFHSRALASANGAISAASVNNVVTPAFVPRYTFSTDNGPSSVFEFQSGPYGEWTAHPSYQLWSPSLEKGHDACSGLPEGSDFKFNNNTVFLITDSGKCSIADQAAQIKKAKGRYVLAYSEGSILEEMESLAFGTVPISVGKSWMKALLQGKSLTVTLDPTHALRVVPNEATGGAIDSKSSWGPDWELNIKPQVAAPGKDLPLARGTRDHALIESLLSCTARPLKYNDASQFFDQLAPPAQQGAGLLQAHAAVHTRARVMPPSISFKDLDTNRPALPVEITIISDAEGEVEYTLGYTPAITVYTMEKESLQPAQSPTPLEVVEGSHMQNTGRLVFSEDTVEIPPGQSATIKVWASHPEDLDAERLPLWSGYITVSGSDGSRMSIPYQGLAGSLRKHRVLQDEDVLVGTEVNYTSPISIRQATPEHVFRLPLGRPGRGEGPLIYFSPKMALRRVTIDIATRDGKDGVLTVFGRPRDFQLNWLGPGADYVWRWNGRLEDGRRAPTGTYYIVVRALRIFVDANDDDDYDVVKKRVAIAYY